VTATVARCRELGWVGDASYARERARSLRIRGAGSLRIAADLEARGLVDTMIEAAIAESREGEPEIAWARRALRRHRDPHGAWRFLLARGFPEDVVEQLLGEER
jgi:SOS response regulatory protein OraA/RecX